MPPPATSRPQPSVPLPIDLEEFINSAPVAIHSVDGDGRILQINDAELRLLGYSRPECVGRLISEFHADASVIENIMQRLKAGEVLVDEPARLRCKDRSIKSVLISSSVCWKDGGFKYSRCFTRDVTHEDQERESRERLSAIVESSQDGIISETLDGTITSFNKGAERLFGYLSDEVVGRKIFLLIPPDRQWEEARFLERIARGERVEHYETERVRKNGERLHMSLTLSPIRDSSGRVIGASKVARDITERTRALERVRQLNADLDRRVQERTAALEDLVRELDTFTHTVAHDLRAPLRSIQAFAQMFVEQKAAALDAEGKTYLSEIIRGAGRMDALVTDLLKYCRLNREELQIESVNMRHLVETVVRDIDVELKRKKATVIVNPSIHAVAGHPLLLLQAVTNLILNAVKFTPPEVAPRIEIRSELFSDQSGLRWVRLWVEDNGIGIPKEYHSKLFRVFERLHARDAYPGTGIGLAIVRRAVERMGGRVGVESDAGKGSRFFVEIRQADGAS